MEINPTLIGRFVRLEPLCIAHANALWEAGREVDIWQYMPRRPCSLVDMQDMISGFLTGAYLDNAAPFAIVELSSGNAVGSTQIFDIDRQNRGAEIGWTWLTPRLWQSGVNTDCKILLLTHCFETLRLIRVQFKTDARNERSQKAIAKLGAVREGVLRQHRILPDGYIRDSVYFSIVAQEWPHVKEQLTKRLWRADAGSPATDASYVL